MQKLSLFLNKSIKCSRIFGFLFRAAEKYPSAKTTPEVISNYSDHNNIIEITTMQN